MEAKPFNSSSKGWLFCVRPTAVCRRRQLYQLFLLAASLTAMPPTIKREINTLDQTSTGSRPARIRGWVKPLGLHSVGLKWVIPRILLRITIAAVLIWDTEEIRLTLPARITEVAVAEEGIRGEFRRTADGIKVFSIIRALPWIYANHIIHSRKIKNCL